MDQKRDRLYPSALLEKDNDLEQRLGKKLKVVNSFNNSINNIKEMIAYFKDRNNKSKNKYKNYKTLNKILESIDTIVIIGETSFSTTLSITSISLIILPITAGMSCTLSIGNKVFKKIIINNDNKYRELYKRDQQTTKVFAKLYKKSLQDNIIDKSEYKSLRKIFTKYLDEMKNQYFL